MELLVGLGIMMVLLTLVFVNLSNMNRASEVSNTGEELSSTLREAQSRSMAVVNEKAHGIYFDASNNQYTLFQGTTYDPNDSNNKITTLPDSVIIASVSLNGGGTSVVFDPLTGGTQHDGEILLQSRNNASLDVKIQISTEGKVHAE